MGITQRTGAWVQIGTGNATPAVGCCCCQLALDLDSKEYQNLLPHLIGILVIVVRRYYIFLQRSRRL